jgi:hypothetical protein
MSEAKEVKRYDWDEFAKEQGYPDFGDFLECECGGMNGENSDTVARLIISEFNQQLAALQSENAELRAGKDKVCGWIPITTPPDVMGHYLVHFKDEGGAERIGWAFRNSNKIWFVDQRIVNPSHWMKLPNPPHGGRIQQSTEGE